MQTKYIRFANDTVALFSERTGLEHAVIAQRLGRVSDVVDAGFVYYDSGRFVVYGKSVGLALSASPFGADAINAAVRDGELVLSEIDDDRVIATNAHTGVVADYATLQKRRIMS